MKPIPCVWADDGLRHEGFILGWSTQDESEDYAIVADRETGQLYDRSVNDIQVNLSWIESLPMEYATP